MTSSSCRQTLKSRLERLLKEKKFLRKIQREDYPEASLGTLSRISKGEFPVTKKIRDLFDLTSTQEIAVCPVHGIVHLGSCKLSFAQKLEFSDMPKDEKAGLLGVFESLSKLSELKELRQASSCEPSNNSPT